MMFPMKKHLSSVYMGIPSILQLVCFLHKMFLSGYLWMFMGFWACLLLCAMNIKDMEIFK